ncbi:MAG: septum formation protein Maf [Xanthomonadales bacterium]|nr:septum formation protein Maf [Xanthomonadales bacterium]ODU93565.1 MAG: septum formation protein Maf [Rhodanobacter sp. SCN 66-43]OJY86662.1 MAG: septum formation protein Maf [Xanthomonadales bacterium 66-474]
MSAPRIVLASTSRYRAELLRRLLDDFEQVSPDVDEPELPGEAPGARALRLAVAKAEAAARDRPDALVIGSDQVAAHGETVLHKPGNIENARQQLRASSGNVVDFHTALCVIDTRSGKSGTALDHTRVVFRVLTDPEIDRYLAIERPFDCAGSFKSEGAGISLFERIESEDPTGLIGMPLIALARLLRKAGYALP